MNVVAVISMAIVIVVVTVVVTVAWWIWLQLRETKGGTPSVECCEIITFAN